MSRTALELNQDECTVQTHNLLVSQKHARMPRTYATNGCSCQKWGNVHHLWSAETHIACHAAGLAVRRDTHVSSLLVLTIARLQPKGRAGQHDICEQWLEEKRSKQSDIYYCRIVCHFCTGRGCRSCCCCCCCIHVVVVVVVWFFEETCQTAMSRSVSRHKMNIVKTSCEHCSFVVTN